MAKPSPPPVAPEPEPAAPAPPAPARYRVVGEKPYTVRMNGCMTQVPPGKIVVAGRYDIDLLREFGVKLERIED